MVRGCCDGKPSFTLRPSHGIRYVVGFGGSVRTSPARSAVKRAAAVAVVGTVLYVPVAAGDAHFVDGSEESAGSGHVDGTVN
ncbi:hypothetical protein SLA2020_230830 [Shorea laevis]